MATERGNGEMWMVRAGRNGATIRHFLDEGVAYIGWGVGPILDADSDGNIRRRVEEAYPDDSPGAVPNIVGMLKRFCREVRVGDDLVTYDPQRRVYHIGVVKSDASAGTVIWVDPGTGAEYEEVGYLRRVDWVCAIDRDALSEGVRNALNPQLSHFRIGEVAAAEVRRLRG